MYVSDHLTFFEKKFFLVCEHFCITVKRVATMNLIEAAVRTVMKFVGDSISPVGGMDRTAGVGG